VVLKKKEKKRKKRRKKKEKRRRKKGSADANENVLYCYLPAVSLEVQSLIQRESFLMMTMTINQMLLK